MTRFDRLPLFLALAGALMLSAGAAQAFTFTDQAGNAGNGQGYVDLDTKSSNSDVPASRFGTDDKNTMRSGNGTFQFGTRSSFDQRYNPSNLFDPYARSGRY